MSDEHAINLLCKVFGVSRSGYYQWCQTSARTQANAAIITKIRAVHVASRSTYGSPRVTATLRAQGEVVGRHRVAKLMRIAGLQGRQRRRYRVRTTDSRHDQPIAPNRLAGTAPPTKPDEVWLTDITYVETAEGWLYLAGVLDLFSRRLIGWAMAPTLHTALPLAALAMALRQRRPAPGLVHHSDRGCQYASAAYRQLLAAHSCIASMSRQGNCYDNATMEAFRSTLKLELLYRRRFATRREAATAIFDYIEGFYNRSRLHSALGFKSPLAYESNLNY